MSDDASGSTDAVGTPHASSFSNKISLQEAYIEIKLNPVTLRNLNPLYMSILEGTLILLLISNKGKENLHVLKKMI